MHFLHAINWTKDMAGAHSIDFRLRIALTGDGRCVTLAQQCLLAATRACRDCHAAWGWDELVLDPISCSPHNLIDTGLYLSCHEGGAGKNAALPRSWPPPTECLSLLLL